jgi:hypothetical protein
MSTEADENKRKNVMRFFLRHQQEERKKNPEYLKWRLSVRGQQPPPREINRREKEDTSTPPNDDCSQ